MGLFKKAVVFRRSDVMCSSALRSTLTEQVFTLKATWQSVQLYFFVIRTCNTSRGSTRTAERIGAPTPTVACHSAVPCTCLIKQACGMVGQLPGCISSSVSCGLCWVKTGRMWHRWQPVSTCSWYVCFDSQQRPHGQALPALADPKT